MSHLRAISELIQLNIEEMEKNYQSVEYKVYGDEEFAFEMGEYLTEKLLLIGYLYCHYGDPEQHQSDLWLLVNPACNETVPKTKIRQLAKDLMHISVTQRRRIIKDQDIQNDQSEAYLKDCEKLMESALDRLISCFGDKEDIDRTLFIDVMGKYFLRTYLIRTYIQLRDFENLQHLPQNPDKKTDLVRNESEHQQN
ncbi:UNKNOWN [Stylonychia lemnae]|uniref:Uncharacterized protein n=1 Tax=Stylonychia lemnae TaxID=5949 RepID=A0A078AFW8_STYLE|nr:UNKNOWN [Stylonychia lemnae]|eukprot:CDW81119.1 UNKNOWN [Stylonychia lemnae]